MEWKPIIDGVVTSVVIPVISLLATLVLNELRKLVKRKVAENRHWAKVGIAIDAMSAVLPEFLVAVKDGKISADEKAKMKAAFVAAALPRIKELTGVALESAKEWLDQEFEVRLGELLVGDRPIGPDDPASE